MAIGKETGKSSVPAAKPTEKGAITPQRDYDPFDFAKEMFEEMDRYFGETGFGRLPALFGNVFSSLPAWRTEPIWNPALEVFEKGDRLIVRADLPGLKRDDIQIDVREDSLVLHGERKSEHEEKGKDVYRSERSYGSFRRVIPLPEGVAAEDATAHFDNGVLEISLKLPESKPETKKIEIQEGPSPETNVPVH